MEVQGSSIDWKLMANMTSESFNGSDGSLFLPRVIENIASADISREFPGLKDEPGAIKLFTLAQQAIQYLLQYDGAINFGTLELLKYDARCHEMKTELFKLQKECKKRRKIIEKQQNCIYKGVPPSSLQKCLFCEKVFLNETFLNSHLLRRHHSLGREEGHFTSPAHIPDSSSVTKNIHTQTQTEDEEIWSDWKASPSKEQLQNVIDDQNYRIGILEEQLRLSTQEESKLLSQERFWQSKFERQRRDHEAELQKYKSSGKTPEWTMPSMNGGKQENLTTSQQYTEEDFDRETRLSISSISSKRTIENVGQNKSFPSIQSERASKTSISPIESLNETLNSFGISPETNGIDTYTFIRSMKALGDRINHDEEVMNRKQFFENKVDDVIRKQRFQAEKSKQCTESESHSESTQSSEVRKVLLPVQRPQSEARSRESRRARSQSLPQSNPLESCRKVLQANTDLNRLYSEGSFHKYPEEERSSDVKVTPIPAPRWVNEAKESSGLENNLESLSSYNETMDLTSEEEDDELELDNNSSDSSPRALKIRPPVPGSKIDVLKSIIEGQLQKNCNSVSIKDGGSDEDLEDDENGGEIFSLSDSEWK